MTVRHGRASIPALLVIVCALAGCGEAHHARAVPAHHARAASGHRARTHHPQPDEASAAGSSAPEPTSEPSSTPSATVAMRLVGPQPDPAAFVRVTVHHRSLWFRVDSGAERTAISSTVARSLGLPDDGAPVAIGTLGSVVTAQPVAIARWSLSGFRLPALSIISQPRLNAGRPIGGRPVVGLLGSDVLSRLGMVTLDYGGDGDDQLEVGGDAPSGRSLAMVVHRHGQGAYETVGVRLAGHRGTWVVDTGANNTIISSSLATAAHLRDVGHPVLVHGAAGAGTRVQPVLIAHWSLPGNPLPRVPIASLDNVYAAQFDRTRIDGLLGADVLSQFGTVTFDFHARQLVLGQLG